MRRLLLLPFSWIYFLLVQVRHLLYDVGVFPSRKFDVPIISIGNLSLGGSGKTPHTEYLIRLLSKDYKVAVLSRGYKRKTKGFVMAHEGSEFEDIGDEPLQYVKKFGQDISIAVDESRCHGVRTLLKNDPGIQTILLDDAFQHRSIRPGFSVLLTDYRNLYCDDMMFPSGNLRDVKSAAKRADVIIVTKTEKILSPLVRRAIKSKLHPLPTQKLYFSYLKYKNPVHFFTGEDLKLKKRYSVIVMFSGVANSYPMKDHLRYYCRELVSLDFPDHYEYGKRDIEKILHLYDEQFTRNKMIITTEKDAMRLINSPYLRLLKDLPLYYLPIEVKLHGQDEVEFNKQILDYVTKVK